MRAAVLIVLLTATTAGCLADDGADTVPDTAWRVLGGVGTHAFLVDNATAGYAFTEVALIDDRRAGGEPVIAVADDGSIIVMAHPGWTHYHPMTADPDHTELVTPANAQSYMWRSTDGGATWTHIDGGVPNAPRSEGTGFSDPDMTVDGTGRIWYTDLIALAEQSVSYSDDHGATWTAGNAVAGAGPYVDRQWVGSHNDTVYLTANYFVDRSGGQSPDGARPFMTTDDDGLTWQAIGYAPCGGDFLVDPRDGTLVMGCGLGIATSRDGASWDVKAPPTGLHTGFFAHEPAIDTAGGIFTAMNGQPLTPGDPNTVVIAYTADRGASWKIFDLAPYIEATFGGAGTHVFAWVTAGNQGRAAVSWIGTTETAARPDDVQGDWHIYTAFVTDAHETPRISLQRVTDAPVHSGPMCTSGTTCQVQSVALDPLMGTDSGDRRMGDFFETTLDASGDLLYAFANTNARPDDVISHPAFVRQTEGPRLLEGTWPGWPTQG